MDLQESSPVYGDITTFDPAHVLHVLHAARRGYSVGDINRGLPSRFTYRACFHVAATLRDKGYMRDVQIGSRQVEPWLMHGGFVIDREPIMRGELTDKGANLLRALEGLKLP